MNEEKIKAEVWAAVRDMNRAWTAEGDAEKLRRYFHKNMVAIVPTNARRLVGQEACVAGWKGFMDAAKIHHWKEIDPRVDVYADGRVAVVTYEFVMAFDIGAQHVKMKGRDMFTMVREGGAWWAVADQFSPMP